MRPKLTVIDRFFFGVKDWQLFLAFVSVWILATFHVEILLGFVVIYLAVLASRLKRFLPSSYKKGYIVLCFAVLIVLTALAGVSLKLFGFDLKEDFLFLLVVMMAISYYFIIFFIGNAIRKGEGYRSTVADYVVDTILIGGFCPLGLWIIQPRLNRFYEQLSKTI